MLQDSQRCVCLSSVGAKRPSLGTAIGTDFQSHLQVGGLMTRLPIEAQIAHLMRAGDASEWGNKLSLRLEEEVKAVAGDESDAAVSQSPWGGSRPRCARARRLPAEPSRIPAAHLPRARAR